MTKEATTQTTVRDLNDRLRKHREGGTIVLTRGVRSLGAETVSVALMMIAAFDDFDEANDPYRDHDFGSVVIEGQTIYFKIDAYDADLRGHSPDPTDPAATCRVMTIMRADEY